MYSQFIEKSRYLRNRINSPHSATALVILVSIIHSSVFVFHLRPACNNSADLFLLFALFSARRFQFIFQFLLGTVNKITRDVLVSGVEERIGGMALQAAGCLPVILFHSSISVSHSVSSPPPTRLIMSDCHVEHQNTNWISFFL